VLLSVGMGMFPHVIFYGIALTVIPVVGSNI